MTTEKLPVHTIIPQFIETICSNRNTVLVAPTGSGKSTIIPQALLDSGDVQGTIVVVQPRRVACRAIARRVAEERGTRLGREVGYVVRYDAQRSPSTKILFVTEGVLIRFLEESPDLSWASVVVFDEFHERRALGDIALGLLKQAQKRRVSLRLVVMSATIRTDRILSYLDAIKFTVEGRAFPVEIHHLPTIESEQMAQVVATQVLAQHESSYEGDILAFLPGKAEIARTIRAVQQLHPKGLTILPLHGELSKSDQDRVFLSAPGRKLIVSTNLAETSVTIPGVTIVIDAGFERRSVFDVDHGTERLLLCPISKMSAEQRAGRAGRERPGICIRLWSKEDHEHLPDASIPEIQVSDLASVVLTLKSVGVSDPAGFDFLDPPDLNRLRAGEDFLWQLGALDAERSITPIGWKMVRLPLSPRYARMVVEAERSGCLNKLATISAVMSGNPVFESHSSLRDPSDNRVTFAMGERANYFSLLTLYHYGWDCRWSEDWCRENDIRYDAFQEARQLRRSIMRIAQRWKTSVHKERGDLDAVRRCLVTGLVDRIAVQEKDSRFRLCNDLKAKAHVITTEDVSVVAFGELRIMSQRGIGSVNASASFVVGTSRAELERIAPHLVELRRIPLQVDRARRVVHVQMRTCIQDLVLREVSQELSIDHLYEILCEQEERARRRHWQKVTVLPGINRSSFAEWGGKKVPVQAERAGLHWALVINGQEPKIVLQEPIVSIRSDLEDSPTSSSSLHDRIARLAPTLARLRGS